MTGEKGLTKLPPATPPPREVAEEAYQHTALSATLPTRPPCSIALLSYEEDRKLRYLEAANYHAHRATPEQCADCLGTASITCILPGAQHSEELKTDLTPQAAEDVFKELGKEAAALSRIKRVLRKGKEVVANTVLDAQVRGILHLAGFPQTERIETRSFNPLATELPIIPTVPDPRPSEVVAAEKKAREEAAQKQDLQERQKESIAIDRPACASTLVVAYFERETCINKWSERNLGPDRGDKRAPIDHTKDEETYERSKGMAQFADPESNCSTCLTADLCPIRNNVEFKTLFDSIRRKSKLESGEEIRTAKTIIEILSGKTRSEVDALTIAGVNKKLEKRVQEAREAA